MKRRDLIKTLALSPLLLNSSLRSFALKNSLMQTPPPSKVFILLNGFFFLEYQQNKFVVTAPEIDDHDYQIGTPDNGGIDLQKVPGPNNLLDLSDPSFGLVGDSSCTPRFPPELLQFSKGETGVGDLNGTFHFRRILPCPLDIIPLRKGNRSDFPALAGNIKQNIDNHATAQSAKQISLVTCLVYNGTTNKICSGTKRCHFYAEPDCELGLDHLNHALGQAKLLFAHQDKFDLQFDTTKRPPLVKAQPPASEDNRAADLRDINDEIPLSDIINVCINSPMESQRTRPGTQRANSAPKDDSTVPDVTQITAVNVANCGQYGVTSP